MSDQPGWTRVPNFILEAMSSLGNAELRVLLAITRKTAGYQKECDRISVSQLANMTGLTSRNTQQAITALLTKGYISREPAGKQAYCYTLGTISPRGTDQSHIPSDTMSLGDTEPYPLGTWLEEKPYPLGTTQKKGSKEKKERGDGAQKRTPPPPTKQGTLDSFHEAVTTYKQLTGKRTIAPSMATLIASTVTDIPKWQTTINAWCGRGFRPENITGLLDWYEHPEKAEHRNGHSNGRSIRQNARQDPEWQEWSATDLDKPL